jgi:hypothetical protein
LISAMASLYFKGHGNEFNAVYLLQFAGLPMKL